MGSYSELYEMGALSNLLKCNIRSVFPNIDTREDMAIFNSVISPAPAVIANCMVTILWSHTMQEIDARIVNNGSWSPNHFVPLMFVADQDNIDESNQAKFIHVVSYMHVSQSLQLSQFF